MKLDKKYKIRILSPEHSEYVQKYAFSVGFSWLDKKFEIKHIHKPYLYFEGREIMFGDNELTFIEETNEEIFIPLPENT